MDLSSLSKIKGNKSRAKRRGRGIGSGVGGHTTGSGMKGQRSRSGGGVRPGFEGGQLPLYRRLPHIGGFKNPNSKEIQAIKISDLNIFDDGSVVTPLELVKAGKLKNLPKDGVKLLGGTDLVKKLTIKGFLLTKGAQEAIEKSGSIVEEAVQEQ